MTVIAYRDGVLASDSAVWTGSVRRGHDCKVYKTSDGALVSATGGSIACQAFRRWSELRKESQWTCEDENFSGILIEPDGNVYVYHGKASSPCTCDAPFYAMGAGDDLAVGAMAMGATAEQACLVAIEYHAYCDGVVNTVSLDQ